MHAMLRNGVGSSLRKAGQLQLAVRHAGGGANPNPRYGSGPYRGLVVPPVADWHTRMGTFLGCTMWLWLFYRIKHDGPVFMVPPPQSNQRYPSERMPYGCTPGPGWQASDRPTAVHHPPTCPPPLSSLLSSPQPHQTQFKPLHTLRMKPSTNQNLRPA